MSWSAVPGRTTSAPEARRTVGGGPKGGCGRFYIGVEYNTGLGDGKVVGPKGLDDLLVDSRRLRRRRAEAVEHPLEGELLHSWMVLIVGLGPSVRTSDGCGTLLARSLSPPDQYQ